MCGRHHPAGARNKFVRHRHPLWPSGASRSGTLTLAHTLRGPHATLVMHNSGCVVSGDVYQSLLDGDTPDIPQSRPDLDAFLSIKPRIPLAEELEQVLMLVGQIQNHGPLSW